MCKYECITSAMECSFNNLTAIVHSCNIVAVNMETAVHSFSVVVLCRCQQWFYGGDFMFPRKIIFV
jgi:hypothetical protein